MVARGYLKGPAAERIAEGGDLPPPDLDDDERLSHEDLFAYLCRDGMGGFGGLTWGAYLDTPQRIVRDSYLAQRDDEHQVIPLRVRCRRRAEGVGSGSPEQAGRELPTREALRIPPEAWAVNPRLAMDPSGQAYCLMFWQVWRRRQAEGVGVTDEEILARWRAKAGGG